MTPEWPSTMHRSDTVLPASFLLSRYLERIIPYKL